MSSVANIILVLFYCLNFISARRVPDEGVYNDYYERRLLHNKYSPALDKLKHEPKWDPNWPDASVVMGQVSGVAFDNSGLLHVFHRASNTWDATTFSERNVYNAIGEPPIPEPTILVINDTGKLVDKWGQNLFYIPHGITVDSVGNIWLTDVALHQVFKFSPDQRDKPEMVLGEKFVPGDDEYHFCKPSAVAVLSSGEFFVADGYCNTRIIKFAPDGTRILQWGRRNGFSPFVLSIPHALTVAEDKGVVCVADREGGRAACFRSDNGTYVGGYASWLLGSRVFSLAYTPAHGGRIYVVNGPAGGIPVRGYVLDYTSGQMLATFAPPGGFYNPHDVAVSPDGTVYVAELSPHRVCKFINITKASVIENDANTTEPQTAKPTATVEISSTGMQGTWEGLSGALGAALGATGAALLALGAIALLRARNSGKKCEDGQLM